MTIKSELELLQWTKANIRQAIIDRGVFVPEDAPFSSYPDYIRQIKVDRHPLIELQLALNAGDAKEKFPVGTEIPDECDGVDAPLVVVHYDELTLEDGSKKSGAILQRKYINEERILSPLNETNDAAMLCYQNLETAKYLNGDYINKCSDTLRSVITPIQIEVEGNPQDDRLISHTPCTFFLPSLAEVDLPDAGYATLGVAWEYYQKQVAEKGSAGRAITKPSREYANYWTRNMSDYFTTMWIAYYVISGDDDQPGEELTIPMWNDEPQGIVPACAIVAK